MNNDPQLLHDLNNYLYGQKALTEMSLEMLIDNNYTHLEKSIKQLLKQQNEQIEDIIYRLKQCLKD